MNELHIFLIFSHLNLCLAFAIYEMNTFIVKQLCRLHCINQIICEIKIHVTDINIDTRHHPSPLIIDYIQEENFIIHNTVFINKNVQLVSILRSCFIIYICI